MTVFVYPPTAAAAGGATEATLLEIKNKSAAAFLTKAYDQIVPDFSGPLTNVYTTKLAGVTQQVLTITYTDTTKRVAADYKVV